MSRRRAYYLTNPESMVTFPVTETWDSNPERIRETAVRLQAQRGRKFNEPQFSAREIVLRFRVTETELVFFRDLHKLLSGDATPFYFVFDPNGSPLESLLVRKEPEFLPEPIEPARVGGVYVRRYLYVMTLTEDVDSELEIGV
jgi:hypothetical protein